MRYSHWPTGDYPIFIDPTFEEILELAKSRPDTLRILEDDDHLAVASGYGNTHDSVGKAAYKMLGHRWHPFDYILYREQGRWWWNPMWHWDTKSEKVATDSNLVSISKRTEEFVKDFMQCYNDFFDESLLVEDLDA
ncbi:MAG: hypothetical protein KGI50_05580 [Patescibacteria group bacterium]|nr:hypothetical protein [Patescibacteria group bacterium]